jgi:hypothetical protein
MPRFRTYRTSFLAVVVIAALMLGSAGIFHFGMDMQNDGTMSGCAFMGERAICAMTALEHIAAWQSAFAATLPMAGLISLVLLLFVSLFALRSRKLIFLPDKDPPTYRFRLHYRKRAPFLDPLQEAFSNGILHPKVF